MVAIPLPFIVAGVLVFVLIRMMQRQTKEKWFLLFVGTCAGQSTLVGLRWSVDPEWVRFLQPVLAACLPPIAWAAFELLRGRKASPVHGLWPFAIMVLWRLLPSAIDPLLIVEFVFYALLILHLRFPDGWLTHVRIGDEWAVSYVQNGVAALLMLSALVDAVVAYNLARGHGAFAAPAIAAMMGVVLVGLAGALLARAGGTLPDEAGEPALPQPETPPETEEDKTILATVEAALAQGLYRDYDLTLQRLSRRTRIPARKISQAVNRVQGCTLTDLVNSYRIREAMRLLGQSDLSITQVMLEAGFQTKSNFNRAFKEIAGQTPSGYRRSESG